jgi:hypothetical protein
VSRRRNPRRAYDENGREIPPPTIGQLRAEDDRTAAVTCHGCGHHAIISTDRFPAELPFPDIVLRLRCSKCGSRDIGAIRDMRAHYAQIHAETGWGSPLPAHYKVVGRDVPWPDRR